MTEEEQHDADRQAEAHDSGGPGHDAEAAAAGKGTDTGKGDAAAGERADARAGESAGIIVPDIAHYLTGWRAWAMSTRDDLLIGPPVLFSFNGPYPWPHNQPLIATCFVPALHGHPEKEAPQFDCDCGIYAFKTQEQLDRLLPREERDNLIRGSVALWGRVVECEKGWRAQFAYPLKLFMPPRSEDQAEQRNRLIFAWALGEAYGVGVEMLPALIRVAPPPPPVPDPKVRVRMTGLATTPQKPVRGNGGMGAGVGAPKAIWDVYGKL